MAVGEIEVLIKGTNASGVTSLTVDLANKLESVGAHVIIDPSCVEDPIDFQAPGKVLSNLKGTTVTIKNERMQRSFEPTSDVIRFKNGETFDFNTDQMIPLSKVLDIVQVSRSTLQRWIDQGHFPDANFQFGPSTRRWVERLVIEWYARYKSGVGNARFESDEDVMHAKGVVTGDTLDQ